jgi:predicted nucleic acid-binding protein
VIVVDTSVWIAYFRGKPARLMLDLQDLLDQDRVALPAPVRIELLSGARGPDVGRLRRVLSALPHWLPSDATWTTMEAWAVSAGAKGEHFGIGDLLIGAIAYERGASIWSLDHDFARLATLGLVTLHS